MLPLDGGTKEVPVAVLLHGGFSRFYDRNLGILTIALSQTIPRIAPPQHESAYGRSRKVSHYF